MKNLKETTIKIGETIFSLDSLYDDEKRGILLQCLWGWSEKIYEIEKYSNLKRWEENVADEDQKYVTISKIVVPTEYDKAQLLEASNYIHNLQDIDSEYMAVNTIMHLYERPHLIEVKGE